jgi:hypothetical protein
MSTLIRVAYILALLPMPAAARQAPATPPKIAAVERGLTPAVVLSGTPAPRRTIEVEMRRLNVPGVSVAVLRNGVIDWSKGYGVTRAGGAPVTPVTLFSGRVDQQADHGAGCVTPRPAAPLDAGQRCQRTAQGMEATDAARWTRHLT